MNRNKILNRNRSCRKTIAAALCITLTAGMVLPAYAAEETAGKDENVYVNLNQDGSVANIYVVSEYMLDRDISISYTLDGKEISAKEMAGAEGQLEIYINIKDNPDSDDTFFDNYLMQATMTLNTDQCSNITAEGATEANVGKNRQLLYNIMAGLNSLNDGISSVASGLEALGSQYALFDEQVQKLPVILENMISDEMEPLKAAIDQLTAEYSTLDSGLNDYTSGVSSINSGYDIFLLWGWQHLVPNL